MITVVRSCPTFLLFFFCCIPCRRSRFSQDLTNGCQASCTPTSSGSVRCFQPRWLLFHFNRLRFRTYLDEHQKPRPLSCSSSYSACVCCACVLNVSAGWDSTWMWNRKDRKMRLLCTACYPPLEWGLGAKQTWPNPMSFTRFPLFNSV